MNNEEKILQMLAEMRAEQAEMRADMSNLKKTLEEVDQRSAQTQVLLEEVDQRSVRTQVLLETDYADKLQLLFDGHAAIMERLDELAPRGRVELLEDDVAVTKAAVKFLRQEVDELKKAQ